MDDLQYQNPDPGQPYAPQEPYGRQYYQAPQQPYQAPQQPYQAPQQPYYQSPVAGPYKEEPVSIGEWVATFILSCIPVVGFIMLIVWLASSNTKKSKKNYLIASLIIGVIMGVLIGVAVGVMTAMGVALPSILEEMPF